MTTSAPGQYKERPTVGSRQCSELLQIQDLMDAMEASLPSIVDGSASQRQTDIMALQDRATLIANRPAQKGGRDSGVLDEIITLGEDVYRESRQWPRGDIFDSSCRHTWKTRHELTEALGNTLANYDATRFMRLVEECTQCLGDPHSDYLKAILRYNEFCANQPPHHARNQEYLALMKLDLSEITNGEVARPGPYDTFDPALVEIHREWSSTTQLTTRLDYNGVRLGSFGDTADLHALGMYRPRMGEVDAIRAVRVMFYEGHEGAGVERLNQTSTAGMLRQFKADLSHAESMTLSPDQSEGVMTLREEFDGLGFDDTPAMDTSEPAAAGPAPSSPQ